jgi:hypothetical protein
MRRERVGGALGSVSLIFFTSRRRSQPFLKLFQRVK